MENLKENQLVFVDEDGTEVLCDILFTYDSEEFKKSYVFFVPAGSEDENGKVEVGVASFIPTEEGIGELFPVETDEEWEMLSDVFESFADETDCDCDCDDCCDECDDCCDEENHCHCGCCHHDDEDK